MNSLRVKEGLMRWEMGVKGPVQSRRDEDGLMPNLMEDRVGEDVTMLS